MEFRMKKIALPLRGRLFAAAALLPALAAFCATPGNAQGMTKMPATTPRLPGSVLLFPATINGANGAPVEMTAQVKDAQEIITDAVRRQLSKGGVGVVTYSGKSPSITRAIQETGLKQDEALKGPYDDPRISKALAQVMNATEYVTISVDNYVFDSKSRRATFNMSVFRNAADGTGLATFSQKAIGEAPADVALPLVEGSAVARGADLVADQTVRSLYPDTAMMLNPPPPPVKKAKTRAPLAWIIPAAAVIGLLIIPR